MVFESYKTYACILLITIILTLLYMLHVQSHDQFSANAILASIKLEELTDPKYLLWNTKCKIPNLNPFNDDVRKLYKARSYTKCTKVPLLSYLTVEQNKGILHIDRDAIPYYSKKGVRCCYNSVIRADDQEDPDNSITISPCIPIYADALLSSDIVIVTCNNNFTNAQVYKNAHATITINDSVKKKLSNKNKNHLSVLCIGIDSVSRLNSMRAMKRTLSFLHETEWLELKGYNKIADNTFPNLMAILTGMNETASYKHCNPKKVGFLDKCNMIWYKYRDLGFVTSYAEDEESINTFNFNKKGFLKIPTDYYFRPYMLAAEHNLKTSKVDDMTYCSGPETSGERIFHLIKTFTSTFKDHPYFGLFWMNSFSHNRLNTISRMDHKLYEFLKDLYESNILKNTIVFFFSDHGLRFGNIRYTHTGWLEERLPFFYIYIPKSIKQRYPKKIKNLEINTKRLTTPYDFYMTLQDLLVMSGKNHTIKPSNACPNCHSLFDLATIDRSCEDVAIQDHWCTCNEYIDISTRNNTVRAATRFVLNVIQQIIDSYEGAREDCVEYFVKNITSASVFEKEDGRNNLLIIFQASPEAVFEATVSYQTSSGWNFSLEGSISRLDSYKAHSRCVHDSFLKKYCYCLR